MELFYLVSEAVLDFNGMVIKSLVVLGAFSYFHLYFNDDHFVFVLFFEVVYLFEVIIDV